MQEKMQERETSQQGCPTWILTPSLKVANKQKPPQQIQALAKQLWIRWGVDGPTARHNDHHYSQVSLWRVTMTPVSLQAFHPNRHPDDSQQETGKGRRLRWRACRGRGHCSRITVIAFFLA